MAQTRLDIPARFKVAGLLGGSAMILTAFAILTRLVFQPSTARLFAILATFIAALSFITYLSECIFFDRWWPSLPPPLARFRSAMRTQCFKNALYALGFLSISALLLATAP